MELILKSPKIKGALTAPDSKSDLHRKLILSSLFGGKIRYNPPLSDDILATVNALKSLGSDITDDGETLTLTKITFGGNAEIDCKESGSTLRFCLPLAAFLNKTATFKACSSLAERPIKPMIDALTSCGIIFSGDTLPFTLTGKLTKTDFSVDPSLSSQFVSGILMSLALTGGTLTLKNPPVSAPYINMTLAALSLFGVKYKFDNNVYTVEKHREKIDKIISPEGDYSSASPLLLLASLGGEVTVKNLFKSSLQADRAVIEILKTYSRVSVSEDSVTVISEKTIKDIPLDISCKDTPDLIPLLAVFACAIKGVSVFKDASRLELKESRRATNTVSLINSLGGKAVFDGEKITVFGSGKLKGGKITSFGDHRLVFAAAVASAISEREVIIENAECINKSYPNFITDLKNLGGI